jgi:hypothetical protein
LKYKRSSLTNKARLNRIKHVVLFSLSLDL